MVELERRKQNSLFAPTHNCQTEQDPIIVIRMHIPAVQVCVECTIRFRGKGKYYPRQGTT